MVKMSTESRTHLRSPSEFALRGLLVFSGLALAILPAWNLLASHVPPGRGGLLIAGAGLLAALAAALRRPGPWALAALTLALSVGAAANWLVLHRVFPAPLLDTFSHLGEDPSRRLFLPGVLLALGTLRAAWSGGRGALAARALSAVAAAAVAAYWLLPQSFVYELVEMDRDGETPVVVGDHLEHHPWHRDIHPGTPVTDLPGLIFNEWTREDLAHGVQLELASGEDSALSSLLWAARRWLSAALMYLQAATLFTLPPLALLALAGRAPPRWLWALAAAPLWATALAGPLLNLALLPGAAAAGQLTGMAAAALRLNLGLLVMGLAAELSGRVLTLEDR
jgi:hypothetical protein